MSDKIDREIEEILNRLDESGPGEDVPDHGRGLFHHWTTDLQRATVSWLGRIIRRRVVIGSLAVAVLVGAGLFFGLVYPSLGGARSGDGETLHESVGDQIGGGHHVGEAWSEGSTDEGPGTDGGEAEHAVDRSPEDHGERHRDGGEH
jgi:hypothetical protein